MEEIAGNIYAMAQAGDVVAATAIAKQMDALAAGIANICYILNRLHSLVWKIF